MTAYNKVIQYEYPKIHCMECTHDLGDHFTDDGFCMECGKYCKSTLKDKTNDI